MTTATAAPPAYFRTQRPDDPISSAGQAVRDAHFAVFSPYIDGELEDFDMRVAQLQQATAWSKGFVERGILAHATLRHLPQLRELHERSRLLDMSHLVAIERVLAELGEEVDPDAFLLIDAALTALFTPSRKDQQMPQRHTVTRRIRELIRQIDPERAYDPKRRRERNREGSQESVDFADFVMDGVEQSVVQLNTNEVTAARCRSGIVETAREHKMSMVEAMVKLLTGEIVPTAQPVLHCYAPKGRQPGEPVQLRGGGWTGPEATAALDEWIEQSGAREVDLDEVAESSTPGYTPTQAMRDYAIARDGTCIFPGCTAPAAACQLDHRIPFDEGGETTPSNLFSLCQHHHNFKTDRRGAYVQDPATGDIIWLFADGTYEIAEPDGLLGRQVNPTNPRWRSSLASVRANRARAAEFYAKGHTILDEFDRDQDLEKADEAIAALEKEYGMTFPVKAVLPDVPPLPEEPPEDDGYDPDETLHAYNPFHEMDWSKLSLVERKLYELLPA